MKVFISADIEGVTGCTVWDETEKGKDLYDSFAKQMTLEVKAACDGINEAGVAEITVKDAHDSGRNIDQNLLPKNTKLIRGWDGGLYSMVQELDETYDCLMFIGYHSAASRDGNPLSHSMNLNLDYIKINDVIASEFTIHSYIAANLGVPVVLLTGDKGLCEDAFDFNKNINTVAVKEGIGNSTVNIHPSLALDLIKRAAKNAVEQDMFKCLIELPHEFNVEIKYRNHKDAYRASHYPGVEKLDSNRIIYRSKDYMEVLRMMSFTL